MADTLPWMGPNTTGLAAEAPKPAFPNDASYWHSIGIRPKRQELTDIPQPLLSRQCIPVLLHNHLRVGRRPERDLQLQ
ncbi:hypothetical protein SKAU_G00094840 [Synaphobranchus kaupii]|uniref:Uncharacterized protein n=1 Tax=Synaphobranchus kaupii TaxID=118154 RepID=A0A9Q1FYB9_SYNKA|nr:hypothetical protein SKAU_G00094840 [Synaphobranchus kaupii]